MRVMFFTLRLLCIIGLLTACTIGTVAPRSSTEPSSDESLSLVDAHSLMQGICFDAAFALRQQTYILTTADELSAFYDRVDELDVCRRPISRADYPETGVIIGRWDYGHGCTASHRVLAQDDETMTLQFVTEGDCPYELLQPFWIIVDSPLDLHTTTP
jgi:hypothetical protein